MRKDEQVEDYDALREGLCPECHSRLDRHEDHARCEPCGHCWSLAGDTISVYLHFTVPDSLRRFSET